MSYRVRSSDEMSYKQVYQTRKGSVCTELMETFHRNLYTVPTGGLTQMSDTVTPGFRRRQRAGEVFFNPMDRTVIEVSASGDGGAIRSVANSCNSPPLKAEFFTYGPDMFSVIPTEVFMGRTIPYRAIAIDASETKSLGIEASTGVLNKRGRSNSNTWETLAELDKTAKMLESPIDKLSRFVSRAGNSAFAGKGSRFAVKTAAELWLAYRYGIRPAVQDISNILAALKQTKLQRHERHTTRHTVKTQVHRLESGTGTSDVLRVDWTCKVQEYLTARAMSLDAVEFTLSDDFGFTSKGLYTLPWELVTASFVADWLLTIGDTLGACMPAGPGWKSLGSCLVMERVTNYLWEPKTTTCTSAAYVCTRPVTGYVGMSHLHKWRQPLESPGLVVKSDFRLDSVDRCIDSLSLLAQRMVSVFGGTRGR